MKNVLFKGKLENPKIIEDILFLVILVIYFSLPILIKLGKFYMIVVIFQIFAIFYFKDDLEMIQD
jgi:hypothetical protein